ncbi:MAG: polyprenyl synthetase family protein [bacterium]
MGVEGRPGATLKEITEPVRAELDALESHFRDYLRTDIPVIDSIFQHLLDGGGKRFRPLLVLLVASYNNGAHPEDVNRLAVSVEFIHTATLLHDDVVDQSDVRRGHRVAHHIWGAEPSVLAGDYLYSRAFSILVEIGHLDILQAISAATTSMARGEVLQLLRSYSTATTVEEYVEVITGKTASLISGSCRAAGYLANFDDGVLGALEHYGLNLGLSFQIVDDLLDYTAEKGVFGKTAGKDFLEGKVTLPVILLLEALGSGSRREVADIFLKETPDPDDFEKVREMMNQEGVFDRTRKIAKQYSDTASAELAVSPESASRTSLEAMAEYVVYRQT